MCLIHSPHTLKFGGFLCYPDISVHKGSFTFLTGVSGCGKSTYLKLLNRTLRPDQGELLYQGKPLKDYPVLSYRREVLLVPQEVFLLDDTIRSNFDFYYGARGDAPLSDEEIVSFLRICCTQFKPQDVCTSRSGGERQRVFLAIFLSLARKVLLLDEPTAALDEATADRLLTKLRDFCRQRGLTVLCVCHSQHLKDSFADAVIELGGCVYARA